MAIKSTHDTETISSVFNLSNILAQKLVFHSRNENHLIFTATAVIASVEELKIHICERNQLIERISYSDDMDNIVTITLRNQRFNRALSRSIDSFVIPEGTSIMAN